MTPSQPRYLAATVLLTLCVLCIRVTNGDKEPRDCADVGVITCPNWLDGSIDESLDGSIDESPDGSMDGSPDDSMGDNTVYPAWWDKLTKGEKCRTLTDQTLKDLTLKIMTFTKLTLTDLTLTDLTLTDLTFTNPTLTNVTLKNLTLTDLT
ncbi:hypothetical protein DFQ26_008324 [Actinomortierella ambigua]|nr:hypothetical protein DFQ26_008324 [Actinomortierella ambigua]